MSEKILNEKEMKQVAGGVMVFIDGEWKNISPEEAARREAEARRRLIIDERYDRRNRNPELANAFEENRKKHYAEYLAGRNQKQ